MFSLLLVDDEKIVLEGLQRFVDWAALGFRVAGALSCAHEAVTFLQDEPVDVLMTDIMMPKEDGFQLIEQALLINPYIKTLILSSYSDFDYAKKALRFGTFDYLTKPVDFDELRQQFTRLRAALESEAETLRGIVRQKLASLRAVPEPLSDGDFLGPVIRDVMDYIHQHFNEPLTLKRLSEVAYVHPAYLSKLFKEKTGSNFIEYLTRLRVKKAKTLLQDPALRVHDISEMVGYSKPTYFSKVFADSTGMSPKDYRNGNWARERRGP